MSEMKAPMPVVSAPAAAPALSPAPAVVISPSIFSQPRLPYRLPTSHLAVMPIHAVAGARGPEGNTESTGKGKKRKRSGEEAEDEDAAQDEESLSTKPAKNPHPGLLTASCFAPVSQSLPLPPLPLLLQSEIAALAQAESTLAAVAPAPAHASTPAKGQTDQDDDIVMKFLRSDEMEL